MPQQNKNTDKDAYIAELEALLKAKDKMLLEYQNLIEELRPGTASKMESSEMQKSP